MSAGRVAGDLDVIVMTLEKPVAIEIERLDGAMRGDLRWKANGKTAPVRAIGLPGLKLFGRDAGPGEQKRYVELPPENRTVTEATI